MGREVGWGEKWEGCSRRRGRIYIYLLLINVDVWQKPTQHCKASILQLRINKSLKLKENISRVHQMQQGLIGNEYNSYIVTLQFW